MLDYIEGSKLEIEKAQKQLKEVNLSLEGKVKQRTSELEALKVNLEDMIRSRTKELAEKVDELERFKRLTVGR